LEDLEMDNWTTALKQYGKELELGLNFWAEPLKKLSAGLKKSEKGIYTRPTNYLKWIDKLKTHSGYINFYFNILIFFIERLSQAFEESKSVHNPYSLTIKHYFYPSDVDVVNNLIKNGDYGNILFFYNYNIFKYILFIKYFY
jgi:hypothetical protein